MADPMNWKRNIQVRDLDESDRFEMRCKTCKHVTYLTRSMICTSPEREFLYLDEVEAGEVCKARGCRGAVTLSRASKGDTSAFVGGLA
ncbi:MAG TPA: hypothetical protein VGV39_00385 [Mesorhizobium sp.]|jgi:hypothetical protein|uniref:hypothetical protein n=1 Tax=Mesorhizobium sp. TaxID=1871066 RepID=UPI002DDD744C|nr:hypothetical protein [Mesorhizobium sp.]HEV2501498.1 hypothetical protein [Mesorhizobium sp.]